MSTGIDARLAAVLPPGWGSDAWVEDRGPFVGLAVKRCEPDPVEWADAYLRRHYDAADLRALGRCRTCGASIVLRQVGRCVISHPCGHYRAQGELKRMISFLEARRRELTPDRRASLLALLSPEEST